VIGVNLQGVFIFCFHCVRSAAVRSEWRSVLSKVSTYRTTATTSGTPRTSNSDLQSVGLRVGLPIGVLLRAHLGQVDHTLCHQLISQYWPNQEFGWEERLRYDLFCITWYVKPQQQSITNQFYYDSSAVLIVKRCGLTLGIIAHSVTVICSSKWMRPNFEKQSVCRQQNCFIHDDMTSFNLML